MINKIKTVLPIFFSILLTSCSFFEVSGGKSNLYLRSLHGEGLDLREPQPTLTLVHFWSTWCAMCKHELITLQNLERTLDKRKIRVVSIAIDSPYQNVLELTENYNLKLFILLDDAHKAKSFYKVTDVPATILLDKDGNSLPFKEPESGKSVRKTKGPQSWDRPDVIAYFKNYNLNKR